MDLEQGALDILGADQFAFFKRGDIGREQSPADRHRRVHVEANLAQASFEHAQLDHALFQLLLRNDDVGQKIAARGKLAPHRGGGIEQILKALVGTDERGECVTHVRLGGNRQADEAKALDLQAHPFHVGDGPRLGEPVVNVGNCFRPRYRWRQRLQQGSRLGSRLANGCPARQQQQQSARQQSAQSRLRANSPSSLVRTHWSCCLQPTRPPRNANEKSLAVSGWDPEGYTPKRYHQPTVGMRCTAHDSSSCIQRNRQSRRAHTGSVAAGRQPKSGFIAQIQRPFFKAGSVGDPPAIVVVFREFPACQSAAQSG